MALAIDDEALARRQLQYGLALLTPPFQMRVAKVILFLAAKIIQHDYGPIEQLRQQPFRRSRFRRRCIQI